MASDNNVLPSTSNKRKSTALINDLSATGFKKLRSSTTLSASEEIGLLRLNDDCLESILRHLSLADLNVIGVTCHRLHGIAATIYRHHSRLKRFKIRKMGARFGMDKKWSDPDVIKCFEAYLQRFGHLIENIDFVADADELPHRETITTIFKLMARYCSTELKSLKTRSIEVDLRSKSVLLPIFAQLTNLNVDNHLKWPKLLPMCTNLVKMFVRYNIEDNQLNFNCILPKMKTFKLVCKATLNVPMLSTQLSQFFYGVPNLTVLSLEVHSASIAALANRLNNLEILELKLLDADSLTATINFNWNSLYHLSKLRKIRIECAFLVDVDLSRFLEETASAQTLQSLAIRGAVINQQFITGIARFYQLRHLRLTCDQAMPVPDEIWTKMHQLQNLKELDLCRVPFATATKILNSLTAAHNSLQTLSIGPKVSLKSLAPFANLRYLAILKNSNNFKSDSQSLEHLNQINRLTVINDYDRPPVRGLNILNCFGSLHGLEKLEIFHTFATTELMLQIASCGQLKKLTFSWCIGFSAIHLDVLASLQQIEELNLFVDYSIYCPPDDVSILNLVRQCPSLKSMSLRGFCYALENQLTGYRVYNLEGGAVDEAANEDEFGEEHDIEYFPVKFSDDDLDEDTFSDYGGSADHVDKECGYRDETFIPNINKFYKKLVKIVQGRKKYCKLVLNINAVAGISSKRYKKGRKFVELLGYRKVQRQQQNNII